MSRIAVGSLALMMIAAGSAALAQNSVVIQPPVDLRPGQIQALEGRTQRQLFQQQQQLRRELDRDAVVHMPRPQVPTVEPSCQVPVFGTSAQPACR